MTQDATAKSAPTLGSPCLVSDRITDYLTSGGLFNPEFMDHDKVRFLLMDARRAIDSMNGVLKRIAEISHEGGLEGLSVSDALREVRLECMPWFDRRPRSMRPKKTEHVCGLRGYDGMRDPPCPACEERRPS